MDTRSIDAAAAELVEARRSGRRLAALRPSHRPTTLDEGNAIQNAVVRRLGADVGGWKAALPKDVGVVYGIVLDSSIHCSPAHVSLANQHVQAVEGEIAFRFDRDLPPSHRDYTTEEVADAVSVLSVIEMIDARYIDYKKMSASERAADSYHNGGLICAPAVRDWRHVDIGAPKVRLELDGTVVEDLLGKHPYGHPLVPTVALVNLFRHTVGIRSGRIITPGAFTGLYKVRIGTRVEVEFAQLGTVRLTLRA